MRTLLIALLFAAPVHAGLKAGVATIDVTPEKFPVLVNGMFTECIATAPLDKVARPGRGPRRRHHSPGHRRRR